MPYEKVDYSLLFLEYIAKPIVPNASPATDAPQERKFKKKVDSNALMSIRKGRSIPRSIRTTPKIRRRRGDFIIDITQLGAFSYNQHFTKCSGSGSNSGGIFTSHKPAMKCGQRGWKRQPVGGFTRLGGSPGGTS